MPTTVVFVAEPGESRAAHRRGVRGPLGHGAAHDRTDRPDRPRRRPLGGRHRCAVCQGRPPRHGGGVRLARTRRSVRDANSPAPACASRRSSTSRPVTRRSSTSSDRPRVRSTTERTRSTSSCRTGRFFADGPAHAAALLDAVRRESGDLVLKVILESGELAGLESVRALTGFAVDHGADFVKTSTGKTPISATPGAVRAMLGVLRRAAWRRRWRTATSRDQTIGRDPHVRGRRRLPAHRRRRDGTGLGDAVDVPVRSQCAARRPPRRPADRRVARDVGPA